MKCISIYVVFYSYLIEPSLSYSIKIYESSVKQFEVLHQMFIIIINNTKQ